MNLLIFFIVLNIINVVLQTFRSLVTLKCGKWAAAFGNALAYGVYTVVLVYMVCDLPLWAKVVVVALCNLVGVLLVKWVEEKLQKDKLWKIEVTVPAKWAQSVDFDLRTVPHSYIEISPKHTLFNFYCATQAESRKVKAICDQYEPKYFAAESKIL